jgi:hypothetical protein
VKPAKKITTCALVGLAVSVALILVLFHPPKGTR